MPNEELDAFVREHTQPTALDVEVAKRVILEQLSTTSSSAKPTEPSGLLSHVERALFKSPGPVPAYYDRLDPDLNQLKAQIAAREALLILHATGVLIAFGSVRDQIETRNVTFYTPHRIEGFGPVYFPSIHPAYRLASAYQGDQKFRLAGRDIYLSSVNHAHLPSRAIRCLKECGDAFRHGLYMSATMTIGAASESLWLELAHLVCSKNLQGTSKVATELGKPFPNIGAVIEPIWNALLTHHAALLRGIFGHDGERDKFRLYAERLRERRNYAMHNRAANVDEPWFTYNETGLLLLEATTYFNQFADLLTKVQALP